MSEHNSSNGGFAPPSTYPGAGKRARRDPVGDEAVELTAAPVPEAEEAAWGDDVRPAVPEDVNPDRQLWADIFEQSGHDPQLHATGAIPVVPEEAWTPQATPAVPTQPTVQPPADLTYDPFEGAAQSTGRFPAITPDGQGLAEFTVELPVIKAPVAAGPATVVTEPTDSAPDPSASGPDMRRENTAERPLFVSDSSTDQTEQEAVVAHEDIDPLAGLPFGEPEPRLPAPRGGARRRRPGDPDPQMSAEQDAASGEHDSPDADAWQEGDHDGHANHDQHEFHEGHDEHDEEWDDDSHRKSRVPGCLIMLLVLLLVGGGLYVAADKGVAWIRDTFAAAEDYPGPGSGEVTFEIKAGETGNQIARNLKAAGVVASVTAYTDAAASAGEEQTSRIQPGHYALLKEMKASDVVSALVDPTSRTSNRVTIPEGLRVVDVVETLAARTDLKAKDLNAALKDAEALGLPTFAQGNPEGFLFPATYEVSPNETAASMLKKMVDRWRQAAQKWDLEARAKKLDLTPYELMTIASLVQAEGRGDDMNKIARVIYNRLENDTGPTAGFLGIDASQNYGVNRRGTVELSSEELARDTPYNLRLHKGLPPTPINNMGDAAIDAATHPAPGDWEWYVTVNLDTGKTKFVKTPAEFDVIKAEYKQWCSDNPGRC